MYFPAIHSASQTPFILPYTSLQLKTFPDPISQLPTCSLRVPWNKYGLCARKKTLRGPGRLKVAFSPVPPLKLTWNLKMVLWKPIFRVKMWNSLTSRSLGYTFKTAAISQHGVSEPSKQKKLHASAHTQFFLEPWWFLANNWQKIVSATVSIHPQYSIKSVKITAAPFSQEDDWYVYNYCMHIYV